MQKSRALTLIWASIKGFFWPVLIAVAIVAYGSLGPWQPTEAWTERVKTFVAILFFIMYFYTQYKRVEKQTDDRESFRGVNEKLVSLEELVKQLKTPAQSSEPSQPIESRDTTSLLVEARDLLAKKHVLAALLQGGVAFEHAIRAFARRHYEQQPQNLMHVIRQLEPVLPSDIVPELHALRMIRNRMTHVSEQELSDLPDGERILTGYEWAVNQLAKLERDNAV